MKYSNIIAVTLISISNLCCVTFLNVNIAYAAPKKTKKDIVYKKYITNKNQIIHTIEINPQKFDIISAHASSLDKSKAQVAMLAKHFNAILGVNGGFFRIDRKQRKATPAGVLKVKNKWHGIAYKTRGAIGWSNSSKKAAIDIIQTKTKVNIAGKNYPISHFNPLGRYAKSAVFSFNFNEVMNSCNVKIANNRVSKIYVTDDNLYDGEYIFTYNKNYICPFSNKILGKKARVQVEVIPVKDRYNKSKWRRFDYIVGGSPLLIYKGKKIVNYKREKLTDKFINFPHGRTALGIKRNDNWVFVVVEENILLDIPGISILELSNFMHKLGCYYAINLDGGSSTSLYIADNMVNSVSISSVELNKFQIRPVTDAILVIPKESK